MDYPRFLLATFTVITALSAVLYVVPLAQYAAYAQNAAGSGDGLGVGDTLAPDQVHIVSNPGRYGLGPEPQGSKYAVAKGKLIRIDPESYKIQSILRAQNEILD